MTGRAEPAQSSSEYGDRAAKLGMIEDIIRAELRNLGVMTGRDVIARRIRIRLEAEGKLK